MGCASFALACLLAAAVAPTATVGPTSAAFAKPDPGTGDPISPQYIPGTFRAEEAQLHDLTNRARRAAGCREDLREDDALHKAARDHSRDMAAGDALSHEGYEGSSPPDRMADAGYDTSAGWGENIAAGYDTPRAVMAAWLGSAPHRKNILNCDFAALGVGIARAINGTLYWTQDFGGR